MSRPRLSLCFDRAEQLPGRRLAHLKHTIKLSPVAARTCLGLAPCKNSICHYTDLWSVLVLFQNVGNHTQIVERLFFKRDKWPWWNFFQSYSNTCFNSFSCFVFFRANIDEVETEVVEIEAKLDKVRRLISALPMHFICQSTSSPAKLFNTLWVQALLNDIKANVCIISPRLRSLLVCHIEVNTVNTTKVESWQQKLRWIFKQLKIKLSQNNLMFSLAFSWFYVFYFVDFHFIPPIKQ